MKHGKGAYIWNDGSKYNGEWFENKINGRGVYEWPDGRRYDGDWKDNNMHGRGVYTWKDVVMKESTSMTASMDTVFTSGKMAVSTRDLGRMENNTGKELISKLMVPNAVESGKMANVLSGLMSDIYCYSIKLFQCINFHQY